jgi:Glycosyl transferase family 2/Methyltransferase domain
MSERGSSNPNSPVKMREGRGGFVFDLTPAVAASRLRSHYIDCPVCQADHSQYLFHRTGVRFVRCGVCELVYVNPATRVGPNWFDIDGLGQHQKPEDRALSVADFDRLLLHFGREYARAEGRPLRKVVLLGRYLREFASTAAAREVGLDVVEVTAAQFHALAEESRLDWAKARLGADVDLVILNETLEACSDPNAVLRQLTGLLSPKTWIGVTYSNSQSLPAVLLRRYWSSFFDFKTAFFNTSNLAALMTRFGFVLTSQSPVKEHHTLEYVMARVAKNAPRRGLAGVAANSSASVPVRTGAHAATFRRRATSTAEKLSIIFPCFNEETYVGDVLEALLAKTLKIPKEVIIVESNSTDGTRAIVQRFASHPDVKLILEERPRGKGHAVRTGLAAATGSIILIQDADFEYDLDDYDALLEPILQRKTSFVLGSRSLGLDDWKVRRFAKSHVKELMLNFAQLVFAQTFNALYQKHTTDINTMFKVFRSECLEGLELTGDRFELDIELVCKLVRNGNSPFEVPVNYVARGFEEGKKISFVRDALPSYWAIFKHRF